MADSRGFVFGPGVAFATLGTYTDGTSPSVPTPRKIDVLQELSVDFDLTIKRLNGQNIYPEAIGLGEGKVTGKIKNARFFSGMVNDAVFGQNGGIAAGRTLIADPPEAHVVPGAAPANGTLSQTSGGALGATTYYVKSTWVTANGDESPTSTETNLAVSANNVLNVAAPSTPPTWAVGWNVYVSNTAGGGSGSETRQNGSTPLGTTTAWVEPVAGLAAGAAMPTGLVNTVTVLNNGSTVFNGDLGVAYASTGLFLVPVSSSPAVGQYSVSAAGVYAFNAGDLGSAILIGYGYISATGFTVTVQQTVQGAVGIYGLRYQGRYANRRIGLYLPNVVSNKFSLPTKQQDFVMSEIDFEAFSGPGGQVGYLYFAE